MRSSRLTPRRTPVQARAVETRQRFLDAAARVFAQHGYSAGTTNRIAAEAGASVGSLYQYFPNKDAILVALIRQHIAEGEALLASHLERSDGRSMLERLDAVVDAVLENHVGDPRLHQVLFEEAPRPPELLAELHELEELLVATVEGLLRDDESIEVEDPAMTARLLVITVESLVHRYISSRHAALDIDSFRRELVTMLTRYLSAAEPAADPAFHDGAGTSRRD